MLSLCVTLVMFAAAVPAGAQIRPVGLQDRHVTHLAAEQGDSYEQWFPGTANLLFAATDEGELFQGFTFDDRRWKDITPEAEYAFTITALGVQHWGYGPRDGIFLMAGLRWAEGTPDRGPALMRREFYAYGQAPEEWMRADSGIAQAEIPAHIHSIAATYFSGHTPPQQVIAWTGEGPWRGYPGGSFWQQAAPFSGVAYAIDVTPHWFGDDYWAAGAMEEGARQGAVFRSKDKGMTWTTIPILRAVPTAASCIAVAPDHPDTVLVGIANAVMRSMDGGQTWEDKLQLINGAIVDIVADPQRPGHYYAAGSGGFTLLRTTDFGENWQRIEPPPTVQPAPITCMTLALVDSLPMSRPPLSGLFLGTAGTGIWVYNLLYNPTSTENPPAPRSPALALYPNPARATVHASLTLRHPAQVDVTVHDLLGRIRYRHTLGARPAGTHAFTLPLGSLPAGMYHVRAGSVHGWVVKE